MHVHIVRWQTKSHNFDTTRLPGFLHHTFASLLLPASADRRGTKARSLGHTYTCWATGLESREWAIGWIVTQLRMRSRTGESFSRTRPPAFMREHAVLPRRQQQSQSLLAFLPHIFASFDDASFLSRIPCDQRATT